MVDFQRHVKNGNLDLIRIELSKEDIVKLGEFITNNNNITSLNLNVSNLTTDKIILLVTPINDSGIKYLDISGNYLSPEGAEHIAKMNKLTRLDVANRLDAAGLAKIATMSNLTKLNISNNQLFANGAECISKLSNLTKLNISNNQLGDVEVENIINKLPQLKELGIANNRLTPLGIEKIFESTDRSVLSIDLSWGLGKVDMFVALQDHSIDHDQVKNYVLGIAAEDNVGDFIKHIIKNPDKYPFAINSLDSGGHNVLHYYNNNPVMQIFLFEQGVIPQKEQGLTMGQLAEDNQGVHSKPINELNHYVAGELVKSYGEKNKNDKELLLATVIGYKDNSLAALEKLTPLEINLLGLSDSRKRNTLDKVLSQDQPLPNDQEFINMVSGNVKQVLDNKYLKEEFGYYHNGNAYNTQGDTITIPETIGLVKQLINNREPSIEEQKELLASLIEQNPRLVGANLKMIQQKLGDDVTADKLSNKAGCHQLLKDTDSRATEEFLVLSVEG